MPDTAAGPMASHRTDSPVGPLLIGARDGAIVRLAWCGARTRETRAQASDDAAVLTAAAAQLAAYFAGDLQQFDLPLAPAGSAFERQVWDDMLTIPYGRTRTYGDVARNVGGVARAVGQACGANPIPILIPCHRVVAGGGRLGGFSGGQGAASKRALLTHEHAVPEGADLFAPGSGVTAPGPGH